MDEPVFTVKKMPAKIVMGIKRRTSNADGQSVVDIPACWQDFPSQKVAAKIPNRAKTPAFFAVYSEYDSDWTGEYAFMIGSEVTKADKSPKGLAVTRIPARRIRRSMCTWQSILNNWKSSSSNSFFPHARLAGCI
ncbi:MAG: effector binding domain-containing protein [Methanoregula sp.]